MSVDMLLSKLDGLKRTGSGRWIARCPAHDDRRASLSIRELEDGRLLVHDFAGCYVQDIVAAVGLDMTALFPERPIQLAKSERRPFPASDVLRCVVFEVLLVSVAAADMAAGKRLSQNDRERLHLAANRLQAAGKAFHE